jgi:hypothetical protein
MRFCLSVDLGSERDPSAFSLIERIEKIRDKNILSHPVHMMRRDEPITVVSELHLAYMEKIPLKTPYHVIVEKAKFIVNRPEFVNNIALVVDRTGVGIPVVQMMYNQGLAPIGISIHGGNSVTSSKGVYNVPKRDLVMALLTAIQMKRFKTRSPETMPIIKDFRTQLEGFQMKISNSGHDSYEAWTERVHDDLVLSAAMGVWYMDRVHGTETLVKIG